MIWKLAANKALPSRVNVKKNSYINLSGVPTAADEGGVLYYGSNKVSASGRNIDKNDSLEFRTAAGFIGDATMTMTVSGDDNKSYTITLTIPVISAGTIKETVTGNAANKDVTFTNSDYKYLYYTTSRYPITTATTTAAARSANLTASSRRKQNRHHSRFQVQ